MTLVVKTIHGNILYKNPPNGGWAWVVLAASFFIYGNAFGTSKSLGIYFLDIKFDFDINNSDTSWISSLFLGALGMAGVVSGVMSEWFDARKTIIAGGLLACLGLVVAFFSQNILPIYIGCFISGIGHGIAFVTCTSQVSLYFDSWRPLANGIMLGGSSVCSTAMPYLNNYLLQNYGWRGSFLILAAISLNTCFLGSLIQPIKNLSSTSPPVDENLVLEDNPLSQDNVKTAIVSPKNQNTVCSFFTKYWLALFLLLGNITLDLSLFVPNIFIVPYSEDLGFSYEKATTLLAFTSIGDIVCRPLSGFLITHYDALKTNILLYVSVIGFLISLNQLLAILGKEYFIFIVYTTCHGALYGLLTTAVVTSVPTLMGTKNISKMFGIFFSSGSFAILASGPIAGALVDKFGNYSVAYWYCLICLGLTAFLSFIMYLIVKMRGQVVLK